MMLKKCNKGASCQVQNNLDHFQHYSHPCSNFNNCQNKEYNHQLHFYHEKKNFWENKIKLNQRYPEDSFFNTSTFTKNPCPFGTKKCLHTDDLHFSMFHHDFQIDNTSKIIPEKLNCSSKIEIKQNYNTNESQKFWFGKQTTTKSLSTNLEIQLLGIIETQAKTVNPFLFLQHPTIINDSKINSVESFKQFVNEEMNKNFDYSSLKYVHTGISEMLRNWHSGSFICEELNKEAIENYEMKYNYNKFVDTETFIKLIIDQFKLKSLKKSFKLKISVYLKENFDPEESLDINNLLHSYIKSLVDSWKEGEKKEDLDDFEVKNLTLTNNEKINFLMILDDKIIFPFWSNCLIEIENINLNVNSFDGFLIDS